MLICIDIFSCQFLNLSIKLIWVIVFVGIWYWSRQSYKFHQHLFCVFLLISQCMCVVLPLLVFLGGYIFISIVLLFVCVVWLCKQFLNHSLVQVNVNLPE